MRKRFQGVVKSRRTFHTTIGGGFGGTLQLTKDNCEGRLGLLEGKFVTLEFDESKKKWVLIKEDE